MKAIITIIVLIFVNGCANEIQYKFNNTLASKNMSIVREARYYGNLDGTKSAIILQINGKKVYRRLNSYNIPEGKNTLLIDCQTSGGKYNKSYVREQYTLNINLIKGHTYEIYPHIGLDNVGSDSFGTCKVRLKDLTKI